MNSETLKQLGEPSNDMEREIFEYLTACSDPELDTRILEKKLSLEGCLEFCFKKGKANEAKVKNYGVSKISEEQHWKWVRGYFGIKEESVSAGKPLPIPVQMSAKKPVISFDDLL